jgi:hypothetical protein
MAGSDEDSDRSRRPGVEDRGWSSTGRVLGGPTIERLGDAMCDLYYAQEDEECDFLGLGSKPRSMGFSRFGLKTAGFGFPGLGLKTGSYGLVIWLSKSP